MSPWTEVEKVTRTGWIVRVRGDVVSTPMPRKDAELARDLIAEALEAAWEDGHTSNHPSRTPPDFGNG